MITSLIKQIENRGYKAMIDDELYGLYENKSGNRISVGPVTVRLLSFQGYYRPLKLEGEWFINEIREILECVDILG